MTAPRKRKQTPAMRRLRAGLERARERAGAGRADEPIALRPTAPGLLAVQLDVLRALEPLDPSDRRRVLLAVALVLRHDDLTLARQFEAQ